MLKTNKALELKNNKTYKMKNTAYIHSQQNSKASSLLFVTANDRHDFVYGITISKVHLCKK